MSEKEREPRIVNPIILTAKLRISDALISMLKALLLEAGFEWVGKDNDGLTYFRKRK